MQHNFTDEVLYGSLYTLTFYRRFFPFPFLFFFFFCCFLLLSPPPPLAIAARAVAALAAALRCAACS